MTLDTLLAWSEDETREHVAAISGFGPKMVQSVAGFLFDDEQRAFLEKLRAHEVSRAQPMHSVVKDGHLAGASFCVTGVLSRKREDVHAAIRAAGGTIHDGVKKGTTYLVAGEKVGKSKLDAAKKHGTQVIDEPTLEKMLQP